MRCYLPTETDVESVVVDAKRLEQAWSQTARERYEAYTQQAIDAGARSLSEADLSYKSGEVRDRVALETVVARLSGLR